MSEKELLTLLRHKENKGFQYVIREYFPMCRQQMRLRGMSTEDAKDLFQESIIVLYEKLQDSDFTLTSKVSTYLFGICQNKTLAELRKSGKVTALQEEVVSHEDEISMLNDDEVRRAIQALGHPCSELIAAFYYHKTRIKELQKELGYSSENSTKQAKYKCVQRLKHKLPQLRS